MTAVATKYQAANALDGMREIVRNEMLVRGEYVENDVSNERLAKRGSICGGRKHCTIGSLWAGAGIRVKVYAGGNAALLPGVGETERPSFLRRRPGLRLAYNALNEAASEFAARRGLEQATVVWDSSIEALFESHWGDELTKRDLLAIIRAAKGKVNRA